MNPYSLLACVLLMAGCTAHTTSVRISDADGSPVGGFPLHFQLDEGLVQTDAFGVITITSLISNPDGPLLEGSLTKIDDRTFGTRTNSEGYTMISYQFKERQPAYWRVRLLGAEVLPDQKVDVIPLRDLPKGSRISVTTPNP